MSMKILAALSFSASAAIATAPEAAASPAQAVVSRFAEMLTGRFDSSAQAIDNSDYLDVTVLHCTVTVNDVPATLSGSRFLALRQSVSTAEQPYRVRILRISAGTAADTVQVSSYGTLQGVDITNLCYRTEVERVVSFKQLTEEKCTTEARFENEIFVGGTRAGGCPSSRAGAVRMTSELTVSTDGMTTWDRGWNASGQLVWGPEAGPYRFEKSAAQDARLAQLASFFTGRFSNAEQVAQDPKNFIPVSYQFCQIDFAQEPLRPATRLMIAQQSVSTPARVIQRNRIYEFFRTAENQIAIRTNPFDESKVPADICQRSLSERRALPAEILAQRDSCVLTFDWNESLEGFSGGTPKEGCPSTFQGSVKFTLDEVIKDGLISPWERWFNAQDEQVAGSKTGPYVYKRLTPDVSAK